MRKQPAESFAIGIDFSGWLADGEAIVLGSSEAVAYDNNGQDVSSTILEDGSLATYNGILQVRVQGGTVAGKRYKVSFRATTDEGNTYEDDVLVIMKD